MPVRLSLCLIARDEEALLPRCLESVAGVVDEVVVCDTGSTDQTVGVAVSHGAQVVHHTWNDDFAAARNAALDAATGDWVLVLDADEVLAPSTRGLLQSALEQDTFDAAFLPLHHADSLDATPQAVLSGERRHEEPVALLRLFRRTPDLRWEGIIHEAPTTWASQPDRRIAHLPVAIVHYGNVPDLREARGKADRNRRLLERHCLVHPHDFIRRTYLARERLRAGDQQGALADSQTAWNHLQQAMERVQPGARPSIVPTLTIYAYQLLGLGELRAARTVVHHGWNWGLDHPNLALLEGVALAQLPGRIVEEELQQAITALQAAVADPSKAWADEVLPGATTDQAWRALGQLQLRAGRPTEALAALARAPDDDTTRLARAEAFVAAGNPRAALHQLQPLLAQGLPDAYTLAAEVSLSTGQREQAAQLLARSAKLPTPWRSARMHRRSVRLRLEHHAHNRLRQLSGGRAPTPTPTPDATQQEAQDALSQGKLAVATPLLLSVLAAEPGRAEAWATLARVFLHQGAEPLAQGLLQLADTLEPRTDAALRYRTDAANRAGRPYAAATWEHLRFALHG